MKRAIAIAAILAGSIWSLAAYAEETGQQSNAPAAASPKGSVCLEANRIDTIETPNDSTILFHMIDGSIVKNTLTNRCVGLRNNARGFTYAPTPGSNTLCGNLDTIHLNDTGAVCLLGPFTQVKPAGAKAAGAQ